MDGMRTRDPSGEQVTELRREGGGEGELGILWGEIMMMTMIIIISRVDSTTTTCAPTFDRLLLHKDPPDGQHTAGQLFLLWVDRYHGLIGR